MGADDLRVERVEVLELVVDFAELYGGLERVPGWILRPAAHFRSSPRLGQFATLIRVHADGLVGVGEAYGLPSTAVTAALLTELLAPRLIGCSAWPVEGLTRDLTAAQRGLGHDRGFWVEAVGGLDLALWDLRGKALGQSIARLLGGPVRTEVPVYAGSVPFRDTPEQSAEHALGFVEQGYRGVKLKVGGGVPRDLAHAAAVRAAVGGQVSLSADANAAYGPAEALRLAGGLTDLGCAWLEEPLAGGEPAALAALRRRVALPLAAGENTFGARGFLDLLRAGAVDVVTPNVVRTGGIAETRRVAALADAFGVDLAPHGVGSAVNVAAALQLAASVPHLATYERNLLPNPLRDELAGRALTTLVDGALAVPDGPGLGIDLDEAVVARFLRRRHEVR